MQIEKENKLSVLGTMFVANVFVECGHCGMGKLPLRTPFGKPPGVGNENCLLEMLLKKWRKSGPSRIIID